MADGIQMGGAAVKSGAAGGSNSVFVKGFLPGLLVGLVVGLTLGAVVPPLLDSRGLKAPEGGSIEAPPTSPSRERERDDAFEGTGLPLEEDAGADASDAAEEPAVPRAD